MDDEIKDLRAQVAREKSDGDGEKASVAAAPPTQVDSQQDHGAVGQVFDPAAPTALNLGTFESCDEDMLFDASESEDEREASRSNGIWERPRSWVRKKGKLVKNKERAKAKQSKTVIIEEENECLPPGPPAAEKQLADVLAGLSQEDPPSLLKTWAVSIKDLHQTVLFWVAGLPGCFQKVLRLSPTAAAAISSRLLSAAALKLLLRRQVAPCAVDR